MKNAFALALALAVVSVGAQARDVYVHGFTRSNGTYVEPYHRTSPDNTLLNNYSTQGNVNPYTGQPGTVNPYSYPQPSYQVPQIQAPVMPSVPQYYNPYLSR